MVITSSGTIKAKKNTDFRVMLHLSAYYYVSAADVEARVIPAIKELSADMQAKIDCRDQKTVSACCEDYNKTAVEVSIDDPPQGTS